MISEGPLTLSTLPVQCPACPDSASDSLEVTHLNTRALGQHQLHSCASDVVLHTCISCFIVSTFGDRRDVPDLHCLHWWRSPHTSWAYDDPERPPSSSGACPHLLALLAVKLNANRQVSGVMRGFDQFMNIVLDAAHDDKLDKDLGMVVRLVGTSTCACSTFPAQLVHAVSSMLPAQAGRGSGSGLREFGSEFRCY